LLRYASSLAASDFFATVFCVRMSVFSGNNLLVYKQSYDFVSLCNYTVYYAASTELLTEVTFSFLLKENFLILSKFAQYTTDILFPSD